MKRGHTTTTADSGIPSNASADCKTFLKALNADTQVQTCLNGLIDATSEFDPTVTGSNTLNSTAISQALGKICDTSFNTTCDSQHIRERLGQFYAQCQTDLLGADGQSGNDAVIAIYDVLYLITPLRAAICAKDSKGYCINQITSTNSTSTSRSASASSSATPAASSGPAKRAEDLYKRQTTTTDGQETLGSFAPNTTTYNTDGLPYLFLTSNTPADRLCQPCTAKIVGAYVAFENGTPYALGLKNSPILSGQIALWQEIKKCGDDIVSEIMQTINPNNQSSSGALARVERSSVAFTMAGAVVAGLVAFLM
ncbi:hypothetical protein FRC15_000447 [Serendipita sp. 397]|nr:hypothetical protein FRC15_000447 [Serendipita sp. 397]